MRRQIPVLFVAISLVLCVGCGDQDEGNISQELANRLSDALDFDDSEDVAALPPPEHNGMPAYPQITSMRPSSMFFIPEDGFDITIETDYPDPASLAGSVVWVSDATGHIKVTSEYNETNGNMLLTGSFGQNPRLPPHQPFPVGISLQDEQGDIGNFRVWYLEMLEDCDSSEQDLQKCDENPSRPDPWFYHCHLEIWRPHPCQEACDQAQPGSVAVGCSFDPEIGTDACECAFP